MRTTSASPCAASARSTSGVASVGSAAPLAERFRECVGLDISEGMVKLARELNEDRPNCRFVVNAAPDLGQLETGSFDFVYSSLVLQHMPSVEMVEAYVGEFLRVLRPGGLAVFQSLSHIPFALRLQPRRRVYAVLRRRSASPSSS